MASPLVWEAAAQQCSCPLACPLQTPAARCLSLRPLRTPGGSGLGVSLNSKPVQLNPETPYLKPLCARSHADLGVEGRGQALLSGGSQPSGGTAMPTAPCGQTYLLSPPVSGSPPLLLSLSPLPPHSILCHHADNSVKGPATSMFLEMLMGLDSVVLLAFLTPLFSRLSRPPIFLPWMRLLAGRAGSPSTIQPRDPAAILPRGPLLSLGDLCLPLPRLKFLLCVDYSHVYISELQLPYPNVPWSSPLC